MNIKFPEVEFNIQFQSNSLIYDKGYSTRQHMIYSLILLMKNEGLGYRRISKKKFLPLEEQ
jgi:hypothetical protein